MGKLCQTVEAGGKDLIMTPLGAGQRVMSGQCLITPF